MLAGNLANKKGLSKYPKAIFLIIATEFCERFSFCGLRTILSLYLRNVLLYSETTATIIYHVFIMACYCIPIIGAGIADSFLGRFRTIKYFSMIYAVGNVMLCLGAISPLHLPVVGTTMSGLILIAVGTGGIKPCVATFGGEQFKMPQEQGLLNSFFSLFYFTINFGGMLGMLVTPLLRASTSCLGSHSCYPLGFGFPAALMILTLVLFICGKPWYKIRTPKENVPIQFFKCATYAIVERFKSENRELKKGHWLDYAADKYSPKLIQDMKNVLAILLLYIPMSLFWSLFDQQGSSWTFQASRTDGRILGVTVLPDQMQVINPGLVLLLIPLFEKSLYPWLESKRLLRGALLKMGAGGFIAACAFVTAGLLEVKLEAGYPVVPGKGRAHLNVINLLPCPIQLVNPLNGLQVIPPENNMMFKNVEATSNGSLHYDLDLIAPYACSPHLRLTSPWKGVRLRPLQYQVEPIVVTSFGGKLRVFHLAPGDVQKSLSGRPKIRLVTIRGDVGREEGFRVELWKNKGERVIGSQDEGPVGITPYAELEPGLHRYRVITKNGTLLDEEKVELKSGGVYSLVVKVELPDPVSTHLFVMTAPNTVNMLWMLPQYLLISVGEVMFAITGLRFSFTQAPKSMKTVTIAGWYLSVAAGNLFVILITQFNPFNNRQAYGFFLYAVLVFLDMFVFWVLATSYKFVIIEPDESSSLFQDAAQQAHNPR